MIHRFDLVRIVFAVPEYRHPLGIRWWPWLYAQRWVVETRPGEGHEEWSLMTYETDPEEIALNLRTDAIVALRKIGTVGSDWMDKDGPECRI